MPGMRSLTRTSRAGRRDSSAAFMRPPRDAASRGLSVPLEELDLSLVVQRGFARIERAQVAPLAGLGIDPARVDPVLAGSEFADHRVLSCLSNPGEPNLHGLAGCRLSDCAATSLPVLRSDSVSPRPSLQLDHDVQRPAALYDLDTDVVAVAL